MPSQDGMLCSLLMFLLTLFKHVSPASFRKRQFLPSGSFHVTLSFWSYSPEKRSSEWRGWGQKHEGLLMDSVTQTADTSHQWFRLWTRINVNLLYINFRFYHTNWKMSCLWLHTDFFVDLLSSGSLLCLIKGISRAEQVIFRVVRLQPPHLPQGTKTAPALRIHQLGFTPTLRVFWDFWNVRGFKGTWRHFFLCLCV